MFHDVRCPVIRVGKGFKANAESLVGIVRCDLQQAGSASDMGEMEAAGIQFLYKPLPDQSESVINIVLDICCGHKQVSNR